MKLQQLISLMLFALLITPNCFAYKTKVDAGMIEITPSQKDVHFSQQRTPYGSAALLKLSSGSKVTLTKKYTGKCTDCPDVKPGDGNRWAESIRLAQKREYGFLLVHEVIDRNGDTLNPEPYQIYYLALPNQGKLLALPCDTIKSEPSVIYSQVEVELSETKKEYFCIGSSGREKLVERKRVEF
jgi:hypothetical protein